MSTAPPRMNDDSDDEIEKRPLDLGLIRWIFGYTRPHARKRNFLLAMVILRSIQLPMIAWGLSQIINGPITGRSMVGLAWGVLGFMALTASTQLVFHFRQRLALELGEAVVHDLRNAIFVHLQHMPMSFFNHTRLGRIISRVTSDAEAVRAGVQDVLFVSLVGFGQMVVAGALMLYQDAMLFLIVASLMPVLWGINRHFRARLSRVYREVQESFSRVTSTVAESIQGIRVTQGAVREQTNARRFRDLVEDHSRFNLRAAQTSGLFLPLLELNSQLFLAALLLVGGHRVLAAGAGMPLGDLIQFMLLANIFFGPIQTLGDQYNQAMVAMAGAERVRRLLSTPPDWCDSPEATRLPAVRGRVRFESVEFAYESGRPVLSDVNFTAEPGETIALVGHTGSGKSTLVNLIAKFYLPSGGRLLIDGRDVRQIETSSLRRHIGIVPQQNFLFGGSVMENIRFARPEAGDEELVRAVRRLGCLDLFESLPEGLGTEVGESGARLSLGQRQLVCFARAMLADPRILLLDEATSSVDVFTERRIQEALAVLLKGRTSFVVAHRLSTIRDADLVLVLDQGRIVERGTHTKLVAASGPYAALHRQAVQSAAA
jgi:ATP-binding cassette, subfamily B, bacterial